MHPVLEHIISSTLHVFYPHVCTGCGSDLLGDDNQLCLPLPACLPTQVSQPSPKPDRKTVLGAESRRARAYEFYFAKEFLLQHLIHQLKCKGNQDIGKYLGELTGMSLQNSAVFKPWMPSSRPVPRKRNENG